LKNRKIVSLVIAVMVLVIAFSGIVAAKEKTNENWKFKRIERVLVIGAGWYRGIPEGETCVAQMIAEDLAGKYIEGARIDVSFSPCDWDIVDVNIEAIKKYDPQIVLWLGVAAGSTGIQVERYGANTAYGKDTSGPPFGAEDKMMGQLVDGKIVYEKIDPNGPEIEEVSIPVDKVVEKILEAGIPAWAGDKYKKDGYDQWFSTAGTYTCNLNTYGLSQYVRKEGKGRQFGMIHIPTIPEYAASELISKGGGKENAKASMEYDRIKKAIEIAIKTIVLENTRGLAW
jgi:pyrrolidone-carboxylate peptidase